MTLNTHGILFIALSFLAIFIKGVNAQDWKYIKERDGIKIYTRSDDSNPVKSFKAITELNTTLEKISVIIEDVEESEKWDKDIKDITLLAWDKDHLIRYYVLYKVQWPFNERDLCIEAIINQDTVTGIREVTATLLEDVIAEKPGIVRISNYWQKWTMEPKDNGTIMLTLEGSVDPGGSIPLWLANMAITNTPLNIVRKVKTQLDK